MREGHDAPSREMLKEQSQKFADDFREEGERVGEDAETVEEVRQTAGELEYRATAEGVDDVRESVDAAEEAAVERFEQDDGELETTHEESKEYEGDIRGRGEATEADREKLSDAGEKVTVQEVKEALERAQEAAEHDIELLTELVDRITEAFQESEQAQAEYRSRVYGSGRSD